MTGCLAAPGMHSSVSRQARQLLQCARYITDKNMRACRQLAMFYVHSAARQGKAPGANLGALHTLWLQRLTVFAVMKRVLCLLFQRQNRFEESEVQYLLQEREKGVKGERQHGLSISHQAICAPLAMLVGCRCCFCLLQVTTSHDIK